MKVMKIKKPMSEFRKKVKEKNDKNPSVTVHDKTTKMSHGNSNSELDIAEMNRMQLQEYGFRSEVLMDGDFLLDPRDEKTP